MRFNTWGNDMGEPLCEVDEDNLCRIEIVRYSDRDFDIYQTARERRLGLGSRCYNLTKLAGVLLDDRNRGDFRQFSLSGPQGIRIAS